MVCIICRVSLRLGPARIRMQIPLPSSADVLGLWLALRAIFFYNQDRSQSRRESRLADSIPHRLIPLTDGKRHVSLSQVAKILVSTPAKQDLVKVTPRKRWGDEHSLTPSSAEIEAEKKDCTHVGR